MDAQGSSDEIVLHLRVSLARNGRMTVLPPYVERPLSSVRTADGGQQVMPPTPGPVANDLQLMFNALQSMAAASGESNARGPLPHMHANGVDSALPPTPQIEVPAPQNGFGNLLSNVQDPSLGTAAAAAAAIAAAGPGKLPNNLNALALLEESMRFGLPQTGGPTPPAEPAGNMGSLPSEERAHNQGHPDRHGSEGGRPSHRGPRDYDQRDSRNGDYRGRRMYGNGVEPEHAASYRHQRDLSHERRDERDDRSGNVRRDIRRPDDGPRSFHQSTSSAPRFERHDNERDRDRERERENINPHPHDRLPRVDKDRPGRGYDRASLEGMEGAPDADPARDAPEEAADTAEHLSVEAFNINFKATEAEIREFFEQQAGPVRTCSLVIDHRTHRFRGSVNITFRTQEAYRNAMNLHRSVFMGRNVVVRPCSRRPRSSYDSREDRMYKRPREDSLEDGRGANASGALLLTNLPNELTEESIRTEVARYGDIVSIRGPFPEQGSKQLTCTVVYRHSVDAHRAVHALHNRSVAGVRIGARVKPVQDGPLDGPRGRPYHHEDRNVRSPSPAQKNDDGVSSNGDDVSKSRSIDPSCVVLLDAQPQLTETEISILFEDVGKFVSVSTDAMSGMSRIACCDEATAARAVSKSGTQFRGRFIRIEFLKSQSQPVATAKLVRSPVDTSCDVEQVSTVGEPVNGDKDMTSASVRQDLPKRRISRMFYILGLSDKNELSEITQVLHTAAPELSGGIKRIESCLVRGERALYLEVNSPALGEKVLGLDGRRVQGCQLSIEPIEHSDQERGGSVAAR